MYEAVILAAGYSSRVGTNKMILTIDDKPIICHVIDAFYPMCNLIHVVSGHYHHDLVELLAPYKKVNLIYNADYHLGMFSSILCGIKAVSSDCFICPGDYPLLTTDIVELLASNKGEFVVPTFEGKRGHPVLLTQEMIRQLSLEPVESNLKDFRDRHDVVCVEVPSKSVLIDVDTFDTYTSIIHKKE